MDKLKKPEFLVSVIVIVFVIITSIYFYKKNQNLLDETSKMFDLLAATTKKVKETDIYEEHIKELEVNTQQLNQNILNQTKIIEIYKQQIYDLQESVEILSDAVRSMSGYDIKLPSTRQYDRLPFHSTLPSPQYQSYQPSQYQPSQYQQPSSQYQQPYQQPSSQQSYQQQYPSSQPQTPNHRGLRDYSPFTGYNQGQYSQHVENTDINMNTIDDDIAASVMHVKSAKCRS